MWLGLVLGARRGGGERELENPEVRVFSRGVCGGAGGCRVDAGGRRGRDGMAGDERCAGLGGGAGAALRVRRSALLFRFGEARRHSFNKHNKHKK